MNLYLQQNSVNEIIIKVNDLQTIEDPIYLFRFVHDTTKEEYLIELDNSEPYLTRASKFSLTLPTDLNLPTGKYRYYVYQSEQTGDEDFDDMIELTMSLADVQTEFNEGTTYEPTGTDTVYKP